MAFRRFRPVEQHDPSPGRVSIAHRPAHLRARAQFPHLLDRQPEQHHDCHAQAGHQDLDEGRTRRN